jgi:putative FmdB family regulatory protein
MERISPMSGRCGTARTGVRRAGLAYDEPVPRYEFRCRVCADVFEVNRPMSASGDPASCPAGHDDTVKLLSTIALAGRAGGGGAAPAPVPAMPAGGGCCGGGCH